MGREAGWWIGLTVACCLALAGGAALAPRFEYNRWDNFEYFTPMLEFAHGLWLRGVVPVWNPHQHMGEPILAAGQPGVLYFPYTLGVLLTRLLGVGPQGLMLTIVLVHLPIMAIGWFLLLRRLGVRPWIAAVAAMSACLGGYVTAMSTVWIFTPATFAWLPWILWGIVRQLEAPGFAGAVALLGGLVATALVGHPQSLVFQWLTALLFLAGLAAFIHRRPARILGILALFAWSVVLSLPALLPMGELLGQSVRTQDFVREEFAIRGVAPKTLLGWLLPVFHAKNGFIEDRASVMGYLGAWIVPALVAALIGARRTDSPTLSRTLLACAIVMLLLLALAGGMYSPLYRATYGIPLWSSFRWPFKLFLMSQGMLVVAAALGLEIWARSSRDAGWLRFLPAALFVAATTIAVLSVGVIDRWGPIEIATLTGAAATLIGLTWIERRWARLLFTAGAFAGAIALTAAAHDMGIKTYSEPYGRFGARELGLLRDARVLPVTTQNVFAPVMQPLGIQQSATANGYFSATGTTAGLVPRWYAETLPCDVSGVPPADAVQILLPSHLLRSFNVGYVVLGAGDAPARALVEGAGCRLVRALPEALVYEIEGVLPRAYFASRTLPYGPRRLLAGLMLNQEPVDAAFVSGWNGPDHPPQGRVTAARWDASRIEVDVEAPRGGFLVISESDFPGRTCRVDGARTAIWRVNGRIMGVALPPGARQVTLEIHSAGFRRGLAGAAAGTAVALAVLWALKRRRGQHQPAATAAA